MSHQAALDIPTKTAIAEVHAALDLKVRRHHINVASRTATKDLSISIVAGVDHGDDVTTWLPAGEVALCHHVSLCGFRGDQPSPVPTQDLAFWAERIFGAHLDSLWVNQPATGLNRRRLVATSAHTTHLHLFTQDNGSPAPLTVAPIDLVAWADHMPRH